MDSGASDGYNLLVQSILDAITASEPDSTPGIPLNFYNSKKGHWCEDRRTMVRVVLQRMQLLMETDVEKLTPIGLILKGIQDPIYTFIKDEPHKREKLEKSRYRIISGVSIVDNLIERVLYTKQNKLEIELNEYISCKPGMGLHDDGKKALFGYFEKCAIQQALCSTDMSAWDWSVDEHLLDAETDYRLCTGTKTGGWALLVRRQSKAMQRKVFQLPSGEMFEQTHPCIQASGRFNTSSGNSHMRRILKTWCHVLLGKDFGGVDEGCEMGDDALEPFIEGLKEAYESFGFTVKGVSVWPEGEYSFCSTTWENHWAGKPESWKKTLFRFLFKNPRDPMYPMYREQLARDLRHHPNVGELMARVDEYSIMCT